MGTEKKKNKKNTLNAFKMRNKSLMKAFAMPYANDTNVTQKKNLSDLFKYAAYLWKIHADKYLFANGVITTTKTKKHSLVRSIARG